MARGSLLIQQKGNQWPLFLFVFRSHPASVYPVKHPQRPVCQSGAEVGCVGGCSTSEETSEATTPHISSCQFASKNTVCLRLTSPPLWSQGAMQIQGPPFLSSSSTLFFFRFPLLTPPPPPPAPSAPSYCSDYLYSVSYRLHDRAAPSLLLFLLSPRQKEKMIKAIYK